MTTKRKSVNFELDAAKTIHFIKKLIRTKVVQNWMLYNIESLEPCLYLPWEGGSTGLKQIFEHLYERLRHGFYWLVCREFNFKQLWFYQFFDKINTHVVFGAFSSEDKWTYLLAMVPDCYLSPVLRPSLEVALVKVLGFIVFEFSSILLLFSY